MYAVIHAYIDPNHYAMLYVPEIVVLLLSFICMYTIVDSLTYVTEIVILLLSLICMCTIVDSLTYRHTFFGSVLRYLVKLYSY